MLRCLHSGFILQRATIIRKDLKFQLRPECLGKREQQTCFFVERHRARVFSLQSQRNTPQLTNFGYKVPFTTSYFIPVNNSVIRYKSYSSPSAVSNIHRIVKQFRDTAAKMPGLMSNLDLMKEADAFPYPDKELEAYKAVTDKLYTLIWKDGQPLGYMLDFVLEKLLNTPEHIRGPVVVDEEKRTVRAFELPTEVERTTFVAHLMRYWRENKAFDILKGWRSELWPVYGSNDRVLYSVERSGTGLLGVMRYGVHMTAYVKDETASYGMKILVARRAANKSTYPNMLDNSVAGGLMTGEDPFECIIREADEEANIPENFMRERVSFSGIVTYIHITDERAGGEAGQIYPETQWVYDIELPADFEPRPKDGEVAGFYLWTVEEVREKLAEGQFKYNCGLVLIDFFIRHKIITPENEPDYDEILQRLHRKLPFPGPHQVGPSTTQ
ncbi:NUDIX hydrolase domain-like protein [Hypoxylon sp. NC0597]|nr:NUDIX hydrolase domain-like protein [Hypoxylon sp. NC0597]